MRNPNRGLRAAVVFVSVVVASCLSSPHLSSALQQVVALSQPGYDFGIVSVGGGSNGGPFTISPAGPTDDDWVTSITVACGSEFEVNLPPPLGSGGSAHIFNLCATMPSGGSGPGTGGTCTPQTYSFGAAFTPHFAGSAACDVVIVTSSGSGSTSQKLHLTGTGSANSYAMDVSPPGIDFGDVATGSASNPQIVTIKNTGTSPFTYTLNNTNPTVFQGAPSGSSGTLAAGVAATYDVSCHPGAAMSYSGTLTFSTPAGGGLSRSLALTCRGVMTSLSIAPNPISFGSVLIGTVLPPAVVTITNQGSVPVALTNFRFTGTPSQSPDLSFVTLPGSIVLGPGSGSNVGVKYSAATVQAAGALGNLTFDVGTDNMNVPITGGAEPGSIGTNPASLDFGPICLGGSASKAIAVFANAAGTVNVLSTSTPGLPFTVVPGAGSNVLQGNHGSELVLNASIHPTVMGDPSDKLTLMTDIPHAAAQDIALTAHVIADGVTPTPSEVHFGAVAVAVGATSPEKQVTLANCGKVAINITRVHLEGANPDNFLAVPPATLPIALPPMASMTFNVAMQPKSNGPKTATFVIDYEGGSTQPVVIDGTGFSGTDPGTSGERETYYACSTSRPAPLWPIAFALLLLRRRRR